MNGVTGRMGMNQHLIRSIMGIREQGGVALADGAKSCPIRSWSAATRASSQELAKAHGSARWTTDLDKALADPKDELFFDAATTLARSDLVKKAIAAKKHIYCEKPTADQRRTGVRALQAGARRQASSTAWCRTSCGCRAC